MRRNILGCKTSEILYMNQTSHIAPSRLVIASREKRAGHVAAEHIRDRLRALYPQTEVSILGMTTQGDQILDVTLSKIGGKGLFVKELKPRWKTGAPTSPCIR